MSPPQRSVVRAALAQVGQPHVWGGDWPSPRSPWGPHQARGGFDCSGLVWMALRGARPTALLQLGRGLATRTADGMAHERPTERIPAAGDAIAGLRPVDLVFFGDRGVGTPRGRISHAGIALGNGWMIHSSGSRAGVSISPLATYWPSGIAVGRRVGGLG